MTTAVTATAITNGQRLQTVPMINLDKQSPSPPICGVGLRNKSPTICDRPRARQTRSHGWPKRIHSRSGSHFNALQSLDYSMMIIMTMIVPINSLVCLITTLSDPFIGQLNVSMFRCGCTRNSKIFWPLLCSRSQCLQKLYSLTSFRFVQGENDLVTELFRCSESTWNTLLLQVPGHYLHLTGSCIDQNAAWHGWTQTCGDSTVGQ